MKWIYFDELDGTILGLSIDSRADKDDYHWQTLTDEAYKEILKHNGQYKVILDKAQKRIDQYAAKSCPTDYCAITTEEISKEPDIDMELERKKKSLKANAFCNMHIENGVRFRLNNGVEKRYTYKIEDQINYEQLIRLVESGALTEDERVLIKASGESEYDALTVEEFKNLYRALLKNKYYHLFYLYQFNAYIKTITDITLLNRIQYETTLPQPYINKIDEQLNKLEQ